MTGPWGSAFKETAGDFGIFSFSRGFGSAQTTLLSGVDFREVKGLWRLGGAGLSKDATGIMMMKERGKETGEQLHLAVKNRSRRFRSEFKGPLNETGGHKFG